MRRILAVLAAFAVTSAFAQEPVTLERIMADPDWIGNKPENPWWDDSSQAVYYLQKRAGERIRDPFRLTLIDARAELVAPGLPASSNASRVYNADRSAVVWSENGDVFWRALPDGDVQQLTRTTARERDAQFVLGRSAVSYRNGAGFVVHDLESGAVAQLADLRFSDDPDADEGFDTLRESQRRIYETVVEVERQKDALADHEEARQAESAAAAPLPIYLGKKIEEAGMALSPDARHLLIVTQPKDFKRGKRGVMPNYVTESGYTETRQLRPRVGRNVPPPHTAWLVDLVEREVTKLDFAELDGADEDPLEELREQALAWHVERGADSAKVEKQLEAPEVRAIAVEEAQWSPDGSQVALQLHSRDNKDRWIVTIGTDAPELEVLDRLSDSAWINYTHNNFGWLGDSKTIWFQSEVSGYSQLYTRKVGNRRTRTLTRGDYVVEEPVLSPDEAYLYFRANVRHPSTWEIHRVPVRGGDVETLTDLGGVNHFRLSPDGGSLLVIHSEFDRHEDLFHVLVADGSSTRLTDTVTDAYKAIDWVIPEIVEVPSSHVDRPIYTKLYLPPDYDTTRTYPAVMFVHGAGYTQNAHAGWPYYFREFMFHTLLAREGVIVIDMDYRASKGYGRDWRTAIYRQMGVPELQDFQDGVAWLAENYNVDPARVGVYGGSYGGFMTFVALFRDPDLFAAGAALRPVADWAHYNHGYTSNILNTPLIDPVAYETSSPIYYAEGLEKPMLIAAGMQDDNVFFQDSVLLVQRLLELQKEDWEIAVYPLDPHGFVHADSWLDEYRRIYKLMKRYVMTPE
ncbi:MAG: prolyl oligopeptidase family serine peptidase [Pseudomonadota bacterium]